jgi:hypothetical protein
MEFTVDFFNRATGCYDDMIVDEDWMGGVHNLEKVAAVELYVNGARGEMLKVTYTDGKVLHYQEIFGTWGSPVEFI